MVISDDSSPSRQPRRFSVAGRNNRVSPAGSSGSGGSHQLSPMAPKNRKSKSTVADWSHNAPKEEGGVERLADGVVQSLKVRPSPRAQSPLA